MDYDKFKHRQLRRNNKQSTTKIATHYTTIVLPTKMII